MNMEAPIETVYLDSHQIDTEVANHVVCSQVSNRYFYNIHLSSAINTEVGMSMKARSFVYKGNLQDVIARKVSFKKMLWKMFGSTFLSLERNGIKDETLRDIEGKIKIKIEALLFEKARSDKIPLHKLWASVFYGIPFDEVSAEPAELMLQCNWDVHIKNFTLFIGLRLRDDETSILYEQMEVLAHEEIYGDLVKKEVGMDGLFCSVRQADELLKESGVKLGSVHKYHEYINSVIQGTEAGKALQMFADTIMNGTIGTFVPFSVGEDDEDA